MDIIGAPKWDTLEESFILEGCPDETFFLDLGSSGPLCCLLFDKLLIDEIASRSGVSLVMQMMEFSTII